MVSCSASCLLRPVSESCITDLLNPYRWEEQMCLPSRRPAVWMDDLICKGDYISHYDTVLRRSRHCPEPQCDGCPGCWFLTPRSAGGWVEGWDIYKEDISLKDVWGSSELHVSDNILSQDLLGVWLSSQLKTRIPRSWTSSLSSLSLSLSLSLTHTHTHIHTYTQQNTDQNPSPQDQPLIEEDTKAKQPHRMSQETLCAQECDILQCYPLDSMISKPSVSHFTLIGRAAACSNTVTSYPSYPCWCPTSQQASGFTSHSHLDLSPDYVNIQAPQDLGCFSQQMWISQDE